MDAKAISLTVDELELDGDGGIDLHALAACARPNSSKEPKAILPSAKALASSKQKKRVH